MSLNFGGNWINIECSKETKNNQGEVSMKTRRFVYILFIFLIIWQPLQADEVEDIASSIKGGDLFEIVKVLASPHTEGRLSGHEGYDIAAKWVAAQFKKWGLKPVYGKSFLH